MKLNKISASETLTQQVVAAMIEAAMFLNFIELYPMVGNAENRRKSPTATGGTNRALDADYPDNKITPVFASPALKIVGDKVQVDQAHERRGGDIASVRATELLNFARNLGMNFTNMLFNATVSATAFDGIKALIPAGQKITAATNGYTVKTGNSDTAKTSQQRILEMIDQLVYTIAGGAQLLAMNGKMLARLTRIAEGMISTKLDEFGRPIAFYNGIPILNVGFTSAGGEIITNTETCGTATNCTSIYALRFGEAANLSIATNKGVEVSDLGKVGVHYTHNVELDAAPVLLNDKAVGRLEGVVIEL